MNEKITELIKGRNDGMEILNALNIDESTKYCSKVEKAIKSTIELINQGKSVAEAAAQAKVDTKLSAITTQQSTAIASQQPGEKSYDIPPDTANVIRDFSLRQGKTEPLPHLVASNTSEASEVMNGQIRRIVYDGYFEGVMEQLLDPEFGKKVEGEIKKLREPKSPSK